jgi:hypothetical protein
MGISWAIYCLVLTFMLSMTVLAGDRAKESLLSLEIINPIDGDLGEWRTKVTGTVSKPFAEVWVVVRPLETRDFWVQPKPTIKPNGEWETFIYLGRDGPSHIGKVFEIRAIANPVDSLKEALIFPGWPRAEGKSHVITVARR